MRLEPPAQLACAPVAQRSRVRSEPNRRVGRVTGRRASTRGMAVSQDGSSFPGGMEESLDQSFIPTFIIGLLRRLKGVDRDA